jgi:hypothetical protein
MLLLYMLFQIITRPREAVDGESQNHVRGGVAGNCIVIDKTYPLTGQRRAKSHRRLPL